MNDIQMYKQSIIINRNRYVTFMYSIDKFIARMHVGYIND